MTLTPEQKEHAIDLIETGNKLEAVRYFQKILSLDAEQALALTEKLETEIEDGPEIDPQFEQKLEARRQTGLNIGKIVGNLFMGIGLVMLGFAAYLVYAHQQFEKRALTVTGTVVAYHSHISYDDNSSTTMYAPEFEYTVKGKTYNYVTSSSSSFKTYAIGDEVDVLVDPDNPQEVLVNSFMEKWFLPVLLGAMGLAFAGMGYAVARILGRKS